MHYVPFFISVEGSCYSNHRNPKGVYLVDAVQEKTLTHTACAAVQIAKNIIPFLDENPNTSIRVFNQQGCEVIIPRPMLTAHEHHGRFKGRSKDYPETINDSLN